MYNEAEEVINNTLGSDDATADEVMIQRLKKRVKSLQTEIDLDIPYINDLASPGLNNGAYEEANKMLEEAEDKLRKYVEISGDADELMTVTEAGTLSEEK